MPDFVPVLIAAVLSLVILLLAFGGSVLFTPTRTGTVLPSKTIVLGQDLVVMYVEGQRNITSLKGEVSQGLFSSSNKKADFIVENYKDAAEGVIKLKVWNSNYYGALIIKVNDKEVYRGVPEIGEKTITFDGSILKSSNTIEIEAESSGWKIWAPTVYIFDADLSVNYLGKKTQSLSFDLTNLEVANVNRARLLIFGTRNGEGNLIVKLNGREIFSGYTTIYTDFAVDNLVVGNNTLELSTEKNTIYNITSVQIVLFF
ncbi:MAG: hypothetical protein QXD43_00495 [Candidatus Aenigmatarchaeota archaeon]